jgi:phosphoribosylamine--glycine ligase
MGSSSDVDYARLSIEALSKFGIASDAFVASAHRTPERAAEIARTAREKGYSVIIALAGYSAHLAGALAAGTSLPVIAVPLEGSPLGGLDALFASVVMPRGVPVATVAVGKAGAYNAGVLAARIIGASDGQVAAALQKESERMARSVEAAHEDVARELSQGE